jgi:hypothetical protein
MNFVYYIYFIAALYGGKLRSFDQIPNVIYSGVAGGVNFDDIECRTSGNFLANVAFATGCRGGGNRRNTVEGFGKNSGTRGFTGASGAGE